MAVLAVEELRRCTRLQPTAAKRRQNAATWRAAPNSPGRSLAENSQLTEAGLATNGSWLLRRMPLRHWVHEGRRVPPPRPLKTVGSASRHCSLLLQICVIHKSDRILVSQAALNARRPVECGPPAPAT